MSLRLRVLPEHDFDEVAQLSNILKISMQSKIAEFICGYFNISFFQAVSNDSRLDSMFTSISTPSAEGGHHMLSFINSTIDDDMLLGARGEKMVDRCSAMSKLFRKISFPNSNSESSFT